MGGSSRFFHFNYGVSCERPHIQKAWLFFLSCAKFPFLLLFHSFNPETSYLVNLLFFNGDTCCSTAFHEIGLR